MRRSQGFIYVIVIASSVILSCNLSEALICYSCNGDECDTMKKVRLFECKEETHTGQIPNSCYIATVNVPAGGNGDGSPSVSVQRGCGFTNRWININPCYYGFSPDRLRSLSKKCYCQYDYCNKGNNLKVNNIVFSFSLILIIIFYRILI